MVCPKNGKKKCTCKKKGNCKRDSSRIKGGVAALPVGRRKKRASKPTRVPARMGSRRLKVVGKEQLPPSATPHRHGIQKRPFIPDHPALRFK